MMMDRSEQERRKKIWKEYQHQHSLELMAYAMDRGFYDESAPEEIVLAEAFSRCLAEKAIRKNYIDYRLYAMPLYWHFDFLLVDAEGNELIFNLEKGVVTDKFLKVEGPYALAVYNFFFHQIASLSFLILSVNSILVLFTSQMLGICGSGVFTISISSGRTVYSHTPYSSPSSIILSRS